MSEPSGGARARGYNGQNIGTEFETHRQLDRSSRSMSAWLEDIGLVKVI